MTSSRMNSPPARGPARRVCIAAILLLVAASAAAQVPSGLVAEALDQRVEKIEIESTPIADAVVALEEQTGLRFELSQAALEVLPYGGRTRVTISIRETSVREALRRVLAGLGLRMSLEGDIVRLVPHDVALRVGRRLTIAETELLGRLGAATWQDLERNAPPPLEFRVPPEKQPQQAFQTAMAQVAAPSALEQLEGATAALGWTWAPLESRIVLCTLEQDIRERLERSVDLAYQRRPLEDVLIELGRKVGVTVMFEPGVLARVDARERAVDLLMRDTSVRQVLERICGSTGLRYEIEPCGLRVLGPPAGESATADSADRTRRWVRIEVEVGPGLKFIELVDFEQLPADQRELLDRRLHEVLNQPRQGAQPPP